MARRTRDNSFLSIEEAAKIGRKEEFFHNIRKKVIPGLIESGRLKGQTIDKQLRVLADDEFKRMMCCGIEPFVYNTQGWTFVAVNAPVDDLADVLRGLPSVSDYESSVKFDQLSDDA